jgi:hypothetical protein
MGKEKPPKKGKGDPLEGRSNLYPGFDPLSSSNGYAPPPDLSSGLPLDFDSLPPDEKERYLRLQNKRNKGLDKL